ncbi:hypothetical protein C8R47DRAFT_1153511 [Mycena vitilis]|nr:hypothetical protein C8R47DRAFT_1153511 [Mycena vitilis]
MKLNALCLPLLAFIFTLSLVDLPPVTALYFPGYVTNRLTSSVVAFVQQHAYSENPTSDAEDLDPENFWRRAREMGDTARSYGEKLLEDAAKHSKEMHDSISELKERLQAIVHGATALHDELETSVKSKSKSHAQRSVGKGDENAISGGDLAEDLERAFNNVLEELKGMFPTPKEAPGHEDRQKMVAVALDKAGVALMTVCVKHGMSEERVEMHWSIVRPAVENVIVLMGDLVEQHPDLLSAVLFTAVLTIIPEYILLRPLLRIFGFGPLGPVKGTPASWAQRTFYGASVKKGSWFAYLEAIAAKPRWGGLGVLLGAVSVGTLFGSCGGRR